MITILKTIVSSIIPIQVSNEELLFKYKIGWSQRSVSVTQLIMSVSYSVSQWRVTFPSFIWENFYCRLTRDSTAYKVEEDHITFWKANQQPIRSSQFPYLAIKLQSKRMNFRKSSTCQTALNLKNYFQVTKWRRNLEKADKLWRAVISYDRIFFCVMTFVEELFTNMAVKSSIATPTVISKTIKLLTILKIFVWNCLCYETWSFESWIRILTCTKTNSVDFVAKWYKKFAVLVIWNPQISSYTHILYDNSYDARTMMRGE